MFGGFTMQERNISLGLAAAIFVWIVGATLVTVDLLIPSDDLGHVGIVVCCGGAVLMVRAIICRAVNHLERTVFALGREVGAEEASRVPLQRVP